MSIATSLSPTRTRRDRHRFTSKDAPAHRKHRNPLSAFDQLEDRTLLSTILVDTIDDEILNNGKTSLREAITLAANLSGADIIAFESTVFRGAPQTIELGSTLQINDADGVTIEGPGASLLAISGMNRTRVFEVTTGTVATIRGLTVTGGRAYEGGGLYSAGMTTLSDVNFSGNVAKGYDSIYFDPGGPARGGAVYSVGGTLNINKSAFTNNSASGGFGAQGRDHDDPRYGDDDWDDDATGGGLGAGGAIYAAGGTVSLMSSTFTANQARGGGGGEGGSGSVLGEVFSGLTGGAGGPAFGGAIYAAESTSVTIANVTLAGNQTVGGTGGGGGSGGGDYYDDDWEYHSGGEGGDGGSSGGGALWAAGDLTIHNSTLVGNEVIGGIGGYGGYGSDHSGANGLSGSSVGGGLISVAAATLTNTIAAGNLASGLPQDIKGPVDALSTSNLIGVATGMSGITNGLNGNLIGTAAAPIDPMLGPLQDNGGPTYTMALLPGSPAIDAGVTLPGITTDQRGVARPQGRAYDIGAFELEADEPGSLMVTTTIDLGDARDYQTSLREALAYAAALPGADTVRFDPMVFDGAVSTIALDAALGQITINDAGGVTIDGPGAALLTISGMDRTRVFEVKAGSVTTISGLTITRGRASAGGGLNTAGTVTLHSVIFTGNRAEGVGEAGSPGLGGAVYAAGGILNINASTFAGNSANGAPDRWAWEPTLVGGSGLGGAVYAAGGILDIRASNFAGNSATGGAGTDMSGYDQAPWVEPFPGGQGGEAAGGAIFVDGSALTITSTAFDENSALGGSGGNGGTLYVGLEGGIGGAGCGGAIETVGASLVTMSSVTFTGNRASGGGGGGGGYPSDTASYFGEAYGGSGGDGGVGLGGGVHADAASLVTIVNTTFVGNRSSGGAGGPGEWVLIWFEEEDYPYDWTVHGYGGNGGLGGAGSGGAFFAGEHVVIASSTFVGNEVSGGLGGAGGRGGDANGNIGNPGTATGGALLNYAGVALNNSILAGNLASGVSHDIEGTVDTLSGHNLIGIATGLTGITNGVNGNLIGTAAAPIDPMLGPLQDNGGPTYTMALLPGSPAIDAGATLPGITTDQRGVARPQGRAYDIGAFELDVLPNGPPVLVDILTIAESVGFAAPGTPTTITGLFTDTEPLAGHLVTVAWGDGNITTTPAGAGDFSAAHAYASGGVYLAKVTITDPQGAVSNTLATEIYVTGVRVQGGVLTVIGSAAADQVSIARDTAGRYVVSTNFAKSQFVTQPFDQILVLLGDGDDYAKIEPNITLPSFMSGGAGNDKLVGGSGRDVLLGEAGDDILYGRGGADLLIGGRGRDNLYGEEGSDLLVGGETKWDKTEVVPWNVRDAALVSLLEEWDRLGDPAVTGKKLNIQTIKDDWTTDGLYGGWASDWYFYNPDTDKTAIAAEDRKTVVVF